MTKQKRDGWISKSAAKKLVIKRNEGMVHTFYNAGFGLIGADHTYESVMDDIDNSAECNVPGQHAQAMGHGLAIIPKGSVKQSDILFVETKSILFVETKTPAPKDSRKRKRSSRPSKISFIGKSPGKRKVRK